MKVIPISFTEQQYTQLKTESNEIGCPMSSIVKIILTNYFRGK